MLWHLPPFSFIYVHGFISKKVVIEAKEVDLLRTWKAVSLCLGSEFNIFLTRSFAADEIDGHGSLAKSMWARKIALNIPCSDSVRSPNFLLNTKKTLYIHDFHAYQK